jgi:hypothetical protein
MFESTPYVPREERIKQFEEAKKKLAGRALSSASKQAREHDAKRALTAATSSLPKEANRGVHTTASTIVDKIEGIAYDAMVSEILLSELFREIQTMQLTTAALTSLVGIEFTQHMPGPKTVAETKIVDFNVTLKAAMEINKAMDSLLCAAYVERGNMYNTQSQMNIVRSIVDRPEKERALRHQTVVNGEYALLAERNSAIEEALAKRLAAVKLEETRLLEAE